MVAYTENLLLSSLASIIPKYWNIMQGKRCNALAYIIPMGFLDVLRYYRDAWQFLSFRYSVCTV